MAPKETIHRSFLRGTSKLTCPTMKFTAEISENETFFLETVVYQGTTFSEKWEKAILDVKTHLKRKPYSIYIFTSYHLPSVKAPVWQTRNLENPTNKLLWGSISDFKGAWWTEASHTILKEKLLLEVNSQKGRQRSWKKTTRKKKTEILPFVTQYQPLVSIKKKL